MAFLEVVPLVGYRFLAAFLGGSQQAPFDMRCQSISGITAELKTDVIEEGGENLFTNHRANNMRYDNLIIKRGLIGSLMSWEFDAVMNGFARSSQDVLVTLLNEQDIPVLGWLFQQAHPVKWSVSDLDAEQKGVMVDTMELAYARLQMIKV